MPEIIEEQVKPPALKKVYSICTGCNGTGRMAQPEGDIECCYCNGTGMTLTGYTE